ncbi:MAG: cation-transporting P-type ATPase [Candidatus Nanopelagicales bacterium]|nr:cation-transporting P-type ATPase [Candidatus Nanopelagicales bacterium]
MSRFATLSEPWVADVATVLDDAQVDPDRGLTPGEVQNRLATFGPNALPEATSRGIGGLFLDQFKDVLIYLLFAATVISVVVGEVLEAVVIAIIIVVNAIIGVFQAYRADQALAALQRLTVPMAQVMRDGDVQAIDARDVVPGDIVLLAAGDGVPADVRLIVGSGVQTAEAALTGESTPVVKSAAALPVDTAVADRSNLLYRGTEIVAGAGRGVVVATGSATQLGEIAGLVAGADTVQTPLQRRLARLGRTIAIAVVVICLIVFAAGLLRGEDPVQMLLTAVSLAVAAVPEALPAVVTITLAQGASTMIKQRALTRRLPAVETLGSVTHICSDKTGTLTRNRMSAERVWLQDGHTVAELAQVAALCNDAHLGPGDAEPVGDPTEVALLQFARPLWDGSDWRRLDELPFDSSRMRMTVVCQGDGSWAFTKGAPEVVLPLLREEDAISAQALAMAADGLRVLVFARRRLDETPEVLEEVEADLEPIGLIGLLDPPRDGVLDAIGQCSTAGVVPIMITGDHPATASAIAQRVGIPVGDTVTGVELAALDEDQFAERVDGIGVYARVDPSQKIRIVRALQARGHVVAMTGDGVNDAPALKQADIGVAMGDGGTDVARGAADLVLLDNNFATLVAAVRQGRRMYDNIRRFVKYVLTGNSGEIWTVFLAPFLGFPLALLPLQILWINLLTDGLPGLALTAEPAGKDIMKRPPRPPSQSVFAGGMGAHIIWVGALIGGLSLTALAVGYHGGSPNWQTMVFTTLVFCQVVHAFVIRSERRSVFSIGLLSNRPMVAALAITVALQMVVVYWTPLQSAFGTGSLSASELALCVGLAMVVFVAVEIEKMVRRRAR